jgi:type I restriction enzyme M protein
MDNATAAPAKMKMILHDNPTAEIWQDNLLPRPYFTDERGGFKTLDFVVANPPFSSKAWSNGFDPVYDAYQRFEDGVPPKKNGDYAFLVHIIRSLKSTGKAAVILPHGVLLRGNTEADIRKKLVRKGYIKGIIVLDKENATTVDEGIWYSPISTSDAWLSYRERADFQAFLFALIRVRW